MADQISDNKPSMPPTSQPPKAAPFLDRPASTNQKHIDPKGRLKNAPPTTFNKSPSLPLRPKKG